ncbi:MAG: hypothetical protein KC464_12770, partial [Myxococcales bacterium]|nr:hypothetical protein [Myxococcales bacterium]
MKLSPSRDGQRLAVLADGDLRLLDLAALRGDATGPTEVAMATPAVDVALFEQELWLAEPGDDDGDAAVLRRLDLALRETASLALPPGHALVRAPFGAPAALWRGAEGTLVVARDGAMTWAEVDVAPGEAALPLSAHRVVVHRDGALHLRESDDRWRHPLGRDHDVVALGGLFDGRAVAAIVGPPGDVDARHLIVLSTRDGAVQLRLALRGIDGGVFAARRGLAALRVGARRVLFVDVRFGKVLAQHDEDDDILDLAVDDAGQHLVVRLAGAGLQAYAIADVLAGRARPPSTTDRDGDAVATVAIDATTRDDARDDDDDDDDDDEAAGDTPVAAADDVRERGGEREGERGAGECEGERGGGAWRDPVSVAAAAPRPTLRGDHRRRDRQGRGVGDRDGAGVDDAGAIRGREVRDGAGVGGGREVR